jgi:hypothetical protein
MFCIQLGQHVCLANRIDRTCLSQNTVHINRYVKQFAQPSSVQKKTNQSPVRFTHIIPQVNYQSIKVTAGSVHATIVY